MEDFSENEFQVKLKSLTVLGLLILLAIGLKLLIKDKIRSVEDLQIYVKQFGIFAPALLTLIQAFQVVVPILPGYLGCAAGAIAFGSATGFWCNYVGISIGSIIAYFLARKFGIDIVLTMFSKKFYDKWSRRIEKSKSYGVFLFFATLLPLFPDDFLCYFSGLIKMNRRKFIGIILLGKPWCILAYSLIFGMIK